MFNPTEIIFSSTTACNLRCAHCFVNQQPQRLSITDAVSFLRNIAATETDIDRIGFSGGEPFLYTEFIISLTEEAVKLDLMFDQIMTNGDWWETEDELKTVLQKIYDAGYDGKIGLSWDSFHGQKTDRMLTFISAVQDIWGKDSINIQRVLEGTYEDNLKFVTPDDIPVYYLPQTFPSDDKKAWEYKKWFKEDYCAGPGHIFYVHADGNIAPCCGFANENQELFIGTINDDYYSIMEKTQNSEMVNLCYNTGLSKYKKILKKQLRKQGKKYPGKCGDICSFCDFVCKNMEQL